MQFATTIKDYMFSCMIQQRKAADGALLTGQAHPDTAGPAAGGCHGVDSGSGGGGSNIKAAAARPSLATAATASALPVGRPADGGSAASAPAGAQQEGRVSFMLLDMRQLLKSVSRCPARHCRTDSRPHDCIISCLTLPHRFLASLNSRV